MSGVHPLTRIRWSEADIAKLTELWDAGASLQAISRTLGRTIAACETKAFTLRLTPRDKRTAMWIIRRNAARGK